MARMAEFDSAGGGSIPSGAANTDLKEVDMIKRLDLTRLIGMNRKEERH